ncbi:hypothetical protein Acsp03_45030 [Actinomadura sp. NBRC 104412]|uniref:hypothetical protein n=1 Tax=Actinomadura sp. NBRC 104412 TaxID=3032203 RepID=UPI0024A43AF1|nr:hypothetical protein [Actinomadura sp. NBRC 104412]GLZ07037.1 hypothetical protein Acsp03_45030 [Actinomadura sp. NBRC 104412]
MGIDRNDPNQPPPDKPDKQEGSSADQQGGGVKLRDNPGSPDQPSRLESKRYAGLNAQERKEYDEKNAKSTEARTSPERADRSNDAPAGSRRRGGEPPPDNPGSPNQPSRLESRRIAANAGERRTETPGPVQDDETSEQERSRTETPSREVRDDRQRDPLDRQAPPQSAEPSAADRDDHPGEVTEHPSGQPPDDKTDRTSNGPRDQPAQAADRTRDNDGSWRTPPSESGTDAPKPGQETANSEAPDSSDRTTTEPAEAKPPSAPRIDQSRDGEVPFEGQLPEATAADASTDRVDPTPVRRPDESTEPKEVEFPAEQERDRTPSTPEAERPETAEHGNDSSTAETDQPKPDQTAEPSPPSTADRPPNIIAPVGPDGRLLRQGEIFAVRPGEQPPQRTEDFGRPELYDRTREGTREPNQEQDVPDITEPDPETTDRDRRARHQFFKQAEGISDAVKKGGNKAGDIFHPNPNKDVLPSTVRDTSQMRDADHQPWKLGDAAVGLAVTGAVVYLGVRRGARMLGRKIGSGHDR